MIAAPHLDHRLAFVILCALLLGAAIPLAMAWVGLLPEDAPPFDSPEEIQRKREENPADGLGLGKRRDPFAIALLLLVTISYILQIPGVPRDSAIHWFASFFASQKAQWIPLGVRVFFAFVPGLAACYSLLRRNFVRIPLIAASFLVLLLWLLVPFLETALRVG